MLVWSIGSKSTYLCELGHSNWAIPLTSQVLLWKAYLLIWLMSSIDWIPFWLRVSYFIFTRFALLGEVLVSAIRPDILAPIISFCALRNGIIVKKGIVALHNSHWYRCSRKKEDVILYIFIFDSLAEFTRLNTLKVDIIIYNACGWQQ